MNDELVRGELFSVERLEQHAESLAKAQPVAGPGTVGEPLYGRLRGNYRLLLDAHEILARSLASGQSLSPAGQWLVDNHHVIESQVREIRGDLPSGYYRQLPKLATGPFANYPRVLGIAWAFVAHTDSRFDHEMLRRFVIAYQRVQPLTIGELWAVAITLRIVLVENLRRAATRIIDNRAQRHEADRVATAILRVAGPLDAALPALLERIPPGPLHPAFAVQLLQRLREQDPDTTPVLAWLEEQLQEQGTNADAVVLEVHQSQAAMSVTVRNIITSMRMISTVDWNDLFESVSLVDALLREGSAFQQMDFSTRNSYRTVIEELARGSWLSEIEVTHELLRVVWSQPRGPDVPGGAADDDRRNDPGHYLIGAGRAGFEAVIGFRPSLAGRLRRINQRLGLAGYAGSIAAMSVAVLAVVADGLDARGLDPWALALFVVLGSLPAADLAVAVANRWITALFVPAVLPGLDLRHGVPAELRTLVVVPTLLTSRVAIAEQIERLEIHFLASPDGEVMFALLTDWIDAPGEHAAEDDALLQAAIDGIARLNRQYTPAATGQRFLLLHRRRLWNPSEGVWMGWERKRGKLHELNRWLRGAKDTSFMELPDYPVEVPEAVRYVVTLDSDTRLPREAVLRLIGKMAHPLNRPRLEQGRVVAGYGILQPRITPSFPVTGEGSVFQEAFSSAAGLDPYAAAISDVYQDLFGEGSFAGKGIYDVDVFERALAGRVPDNAMLSHDLFEGVFARAGLVTDIEVVEESPARYSVALSRQQRWTRGDWQLLPWILGPRSAQVPAVGRWKMLDNLRRSLTAPATVLALSCGWWLDLEQALFWTGFLLLTVGLPPLLPVLGDLRPRHGWNSLRGHLRALADGLRLAGTQIGLLVTLLAEQATRMADAVLRALYRLLVSRRRLLEWTTAEQAKSALPEDIVAQYRSMPGTILIGAATLVAPLLAAPALAQPGVWMLSTPLAALWLLAPAIAWWASQSREAGTEMAVEQDRRELRRIARRTWRFFETFVTPADNMLPPDNFQEDPKPVVAHRTSPTNIGLYLLSVASARDFGWIGLDDAAGRLEATLDTMDRLERLHGHFYNWYDTSDLRPLDPRYISSVDSGNLAGHLIALANSCEAWIAAPLAGAWMVDGVADAVELVRDTLRHAPDEEDPRRVGQVREVVEALGDRVIAARASAAEEHAQIDALQVRTSLLAEAAQALQAARPTPSTAEILYWSEAAHRSAMAHSRDLALLARASETESASLATLAGGTEDGEGRSGARDLQGRLRAMAARARAMAEAMHFDFLLDPERKLLSIGYRVSDSTLDPSCYDLLASEARLASFWAISVCDAPVSHWFRLGRSVTSVGRALALISWSGSMFEYLMPSLVMRAPVGSLLASTNRMIVRRQISYAAERGVPWGMSESAFNARDLEMTYQYSNFGIPNLALKRGLAENLVIAPYATALAAMLDPTASARNFERLAAAGGLGVYGFYEAMDYTKARVLDGQDVAIVRAYMAHHQGMTIVAILNALQDGRMRARFHAEPRVQASELLLQERAPRAAMLLSERVADAPLGFDAIDQDLPSARRLISPHGAIPATHVLSNGRYSVMVTAAGSGYSRWHGRAITRWREDATCDDWGSYVFLRDVATDAVWSAGFQPSGVEADSYSVSFTEERAEIIRRDGTLLCTTEIVVSAEDDAEVRRVTLVNLGDTVREIELTSYMELVLAAPADDVAHPAFSKMFVRTEFIPETGVVLATRRRRSPTEPEIWAAHLVVAEAETIGDLLVETDRAAFLGRGRSLRHPVAMEGGRPLAGNVGTVLDPIFSLRRRVRIAPGASARLAFWTIAADSRTALLDQADRHHDRAAFERAFTLAWTQAQVQLRHISIHRADAIRFQRLAGHLIYANPMLRPPSEVLRRGGGAQSQLWAHGISGDLPILLVRIDTLEDVEFVRQLLQAHEYWRLKQIAVDLVILNDKPPSYEQDLQVALDAAVRMGHTRTALAGSTVQGSVFELRADLVAPATQALLLSIARVVLVSGRGRLADQLDRLEDQAILPPPRPTVWPEQQEHPEGWPAPELEFFNGTGGFAEDGREYVIVLDGGRTTPAPWTNIVANPSFGFQATAEGGGCSWWLNSRENQLTPWSNDPVEDRSGDILYLRDEESGAVWGATALPVRPPGALYRIHHGMGYSRFRSLAYGIEADLLQFVPVADPVKISRLRLRNATGRTRRLSVTSYVEWVLGPSRAGSAPMIVTEHDAGSGAVLARNPWNTTFGAFVGFAAMPGRQVSATADRCEFIGRNGTLAWPAALASQQELAGTFGAGLDPCAALQTGFELHPGESMEIVFLLGATETVENVRSLVGRYGVDDLDAAMQAVISQWEAVLGTTQVTTPDRAMDVMLNGWLLYQTLACRIWARAGFYQASGAYGFRDQLQDGMALVTVRPDLTRAHLLRAAGRQFPEGDVQHWWLPPAGQGVRTRISDDRVWLAVAACRYVAVTADHAVLDEPVPFLEGPTLGEHEHEAYFSPTTSERAASLYEHCALGLDHSLATGLHGLPLIGTGDWNDGMSRVGEGGKGESVWLGWFLYAALMEFAPVAQARGELARAEAWRTHAAALQAAIERESWDGGWYRRGYFDDGTPLGSVANGECRIDAIAQSWAVISGAGDPDRARRAMAAVDDHLIRRHDGLALLFTPPFDRTPLDPGYIKGYPPGIRENGGQYTHAGTWSVIALAMRGEGDRAGELFAMLNPVHHALTAADAYRYKVEPYVVAADVYNAPGHVGRGGWTWYTGSAGWMYRAGLEGILGLQRRGTELRLDPCVPKAWKGFGIRVRHGAGVYEIQVENPNGVSQGVAHAELDGVALTERPVRIPLGADGADHVVRLVLG